MIHNASGMVWGDKTAMRTTADLLEKVEGTIVNDYTSREGVRKALNIALWGICAVLIVLGTLVILTFDPCPANGPAELLPSFCPAR